jgi:hypothetical protein
MSVIFENPLKFDLDVIDLEESSSTVKMRLKAEVIQFNQKIGYDGTFWILWVDLKEFKDSLLIKNRDLWSIKDIEGYFIFELRDSGAEKSISWRNTRRDVVGNRKVDLFFSASLDVNTFEKIRTDFAELPDFFDS